MVDAKPSDGIAIDPAANPDDLDKAADQALNIDLLPPSKLSPTRQFTVLSGWWKSDADFSRDWRAQARLMFQFRAGEQWTPEDKSTLDNQQRPHIVFNRVLTILKAVAGMEINGRHEIHFIPRNSEDTAINEVLSAASKWMADSCDGEDEESQAFDQCCTTGLGVCENRMSFDDDPMGLYVEEQVMCLEMYWDRTARKKNLSDSRRFSRVRRMPLGDAMRMFPGFTREQLDAVWAIDGPLDYPQKSLEQKWKRDTNNTMDLPYDDQCEVTIVQMQWIEFETYWLVADPMTNSKAELSDQQYRTFEKRMQMLGMSVDAAKLTRKIYKQAFLGAQDVMLRPAGPAPIAGQFTWKFITGELDAVKGTWFGLVAVMKDPQQWANKWLSQVLHILNTTAKGGIIAERAAFDDEREAEDSYAQPDAISWAADGALSGPNPKIMPKPGSGVVEGHLGLMQFAISSIKDVTGINLELLGQQDQNQPGILEAMRKQAGMTVLATLFDSLRRFRKQTGRARLFFIQNFLSDGRLIRVVGNDEAKVVALAKDKTVGEYDVIVDDTPTSPNQKEANWAIIQPMLAIFKDQLMSNPEVFAMLLEYSPLPSRVVEAVKAFIKQGQNDPKNQQEQQENRQLQIAGAVASINKDQSIAEMNDAKAGATQSTAVYDIAMARNLLSKNDSEGLAAHLKAMELAIKARQTQAQGDKIAADTAHTHAQTVRELAGVHTDLANSDAQAHDAATKHLQAVHGMTTDRTSQLIDHLGAVTKAHRDVAAATKDHAAARQIERTPVTAPQP
jgi:hypothetical protein